MSTLVECLLALPRSRVSLSGIHSARPTRPLGLFFSSPALSPCFSVGKDQVQAYADRKGMTLEEAEKWLGPNLNYDN